MIFLIIDTLSDIAFFQQTPLSRGAGTKRSGPNRALISGEKTPGETNLLEYCL